MMRAVFFTIPGLIALYLVLRSSGPEQAALVLVAAAAFIVALWNALLRD
jgi:hypothetical protein